MVLIWGIHAVTCGGAGDDVMVVAGSKRWAEGISQALAVAGVDVGGEED
jgi:hypothetical protein